MSSTYQTTQETQRQAIPPIMIEANTSSYEKRSYFEFVVPAGNGTVNATIDLRTLPANARILGGHIAFDAMSTAGGTAGIEIGTAADATHYLGSTSVDAAGSADFANTTALNFGEVLTADTTIIATILTEAWVAAGKLRGFISWMHI